MYMQQPTCTCNVASMLTLHVSCDCLYIFIAGTCIYFFIQLLQKNMSSLGNAVNTLKCSLSSTKVFNSSVLCHLLDTCFSVNNITFTFCKVYGQIIYM